MVAFGFEMSQSTDKTVPADSMSSEYAVGWLNFEFVGGGIPRASQQRPLTSSVIRGHQLSRKAPGTRQVLQILLPYPKNCHRHIVTLGVGAGGSELHLRCLGHRL